MSNIARERTSRSNSIFSCYKSIKSGLQCTLPLNIESKTSTRGIDEFPNVLGQNFGLRLFIYNKSTTLMQT